jgi:signal transduction histidine kinase
MIEPSLLPFELKKTMQHAASTMTTRISGSVRALGRGSLLLRFSLLSLVALALIALGLGWVLQQQMESNALEQQANEVAVVLEGTMSRHLTARDVSVAAGRTQRSRWQWLAGTLLAADRHLVRVKVWDSRGGVVYSNDPRQIGKYFPIDDNLRSALSGRRSMDVSNLSQKENALDRQRYTSLLETYIPIRARGKVIGAYEAYSDLGGVHAQMDSARRKIWISVGLGFFLLYASLFAIVRGASRRLIRQMQAITNLEFQAREAETLRRVDRLKDEFIGSVSHELRRPLASIKGYTASLLLPETQWKPELQHEFLQVIDEEADRLAHLIDNLLDLARLGSGSLPLNREPVHLPAITAQVVRRVRSQSHLPSHPYEVRFPDRFPVIEADPERIRQLLLNLLENASKYAPERTPILIEGAVQGDTVEVRVVDQGPGLNPEQALHVFDKFYRVDSGLTRATEGTGLGLAICRGVVEAHGGEISVASEPGHGCTFTVQLPAVLEEKQRLFDALQPPTDVSWPTKPVYPGEEP